MQKPKLTMIELFSGIGAQKRGIDNTELYDLDVVATSDIDKEAVVEYAAIHHGLTNEMIENYENYPSREEMIEELKSRNIGMDFDKDKMFNWDKLLKKKTKEIEKYWLAMTLQNNLGDISRIEQLPTADCWFYSSPCQCFSLAGKQDGIDVTCNACGNKYNPMDLDVEHRYICPHCGSDDIKGTRSGLLLEVERLLLKAIETNTAPKYLCLENVKNLVSKKFKPDFDAWVKRLENLGYNSYYQVLNAKECGVAQNRERIFCMSIRKDIDTKKYTFPLPFDTGLRLKDILEKEVDEKYYINTERASNLIQQLVDKGQLKGQRACCDSTINDPNVRDISNCITARYDASIQNKKSIGLAVAEPDAKRIGGLWDGETRHQAGSVWDSDGMSPTLDTAQGGGRQPHIVEEKTEPSFVIGSTQKNAFVGNGEISSALTSAMGMGGGHVPMIGLENNITETNQNNNEISSKEKPKSIWKDINSHYKISSKGVVVDIINKCQVEEIDGKVELEVKGKMAKFPIEALMKKYFQEEMKLDKINAESEETTVIGIKQATKKGYIECELPGLADFSYPTSKLRRGRVQDNGQTCPTLTAAEGGIRYIESIYRIRKLTVRECFKLMGFEFSDWDKCEAIGISNSAGYKAAGNSIVTNCISLLFEHLYKAQYDESYICTDEKMQNFHKPEA